MNKPSTDPQEGRRVVACSGRTIFRRGTTVKTHIRIQYALNDGSLGERVLVKATAQRTVPQ